MSDIREVQIKRNRNHANCRSVESTITEKTERYHRKLAENKSRFQQSKRETNSSLYLFKDASICDLRSQHDHSQLICKKLLKDANPNDPQIDTRQLGRQLNSCEDRMKKDFRSLRRNFKSYRE